MPAPSRGISSLGMRSFLPALGCASSQASLPKQGLTQTQLPKAIGSAPIASTSGFLCFYRTPLGNKQFTISGVTRDASGAVLGGCAVSLFTSADNVLRYTTISDPTTGVYSFIVPSNGWAFYAVAYLPGSPDVAGTTLNTLLGA